jgi:hypothetical protein
MRDPKTWLQIKARLQIRVRLQTKAGLQIPQDCGSKSKRLLGRLVDAHSDRHGSLRLTQ